MCFKFATLALVCLSGAVLASARRHHVQPNLSAAPAAALKRQVGSGGASALIEKADDEDHVGSETGFIGNAAGAAHAGSKYFQYIHVPAKDHYEHGHKRGNEHHFIERHEKAHPHAGEFKTKVRWGDKHGGYGEHYWDYNHAGHHDGDGEESQQNEEYATYNEEESKQRPVKYIGGASDRQKRTPANPDADVEFINDAARQQFRQGRAPRHGGNYRRADDDFRYKRSQDGALQANGDEGWRLLL